MTIADLLKSKLEILTSNLFQKQQDPFRMVFEFTTTYAISAYHH